MKITTKRNKPLFYRQNWHKVQRLGQKVKRLRKWRAAKGGDSKTRLKERGKPARPTIGWGASKETFGNVKGFTPIRVETLNDFIKFTDKKMQGVIIGSVGKSQSLTEGIYLENVKDALITDNLLEKQSSGGIELKNSKNITMGGNWIDINNGAGISLDKTTQGLIVNNYLNNTMNTRILGDSNATWNFEKRNGPNIMNGPYAGGNYWASPDGKGFSQQCNGRGDGFCNESYILNAQNKDNLPLTLIYIKPLPDQALPPTDPDKDGLYKDINGNGKKDYEDIVLDFQYLDWIRDNEPLNYFDFDRNGKIDYEDVVTLFSDIG